MKSINIDATNSTQPARLHRSEPVRPKDGETSVPSPTKVTPDHVDVSPRAEEASRLVARAAESRDFRPERVSLLQQAIRSGEYHVSSSAIADAIMRDEGA
jgi:flagellar biosynthesis anti-sigma factor FlgM